MVQTRSRSSPNVVPEQLQNAQGKVFSVHADPKQNFASVFLTSDVAGIPKGTHVTFSLEDWKDSELPRPDQIVNLENLRLFTRGWRALRAKPITA